MSKLSITCCTKATPAVMTFLDRIAALAGDLDSEMVFGGDGPGVPEILRKEYNGATVIEVSTAGYQESIGDQLLDASTGDYVLRIDDDETISPIMERWLKDECYLTGDHWRFARAWKFVDEAHYIASVPHWPDYQTRLSVRAKAADSVGLHPGFRPFGDGVTGPGAIEHHKLLITSHAQRVAQCAAYDAISPGAGMRTFYLPEDHPERLIIAHWLDNLTPEELIRLSQKLGMPMQQHGAEILDFIYWYMDRFWRPTRVLEIGTGHGGTAALWCEFVNGPGAQVVSVDIPLGVHGGNTPEANKERDAKLRERYPTIFTAITADSQLESTRDEVLKVMGGPFDIVFIDGLHTYDGASRDFALYSPLAKEGGVILFHDIDNTPFYAGLAVNVQQLWNELQGEKRAWSIGDPMWGGLGALISGGAA